MYIRLPVICSIASETDATSTRRNSAISWLSDKVAGELDWARTIRTVPLAARIKPNAANKMTSALRFLYPYDLSIPSSRLYICSRTLTLFVPKLEERSVQAKRPIKETRMRLKAGMAFFCWLSLLLCIGAFLESSSQAQQNDSWDDDLKTSAGPGEHTFTSTCAGCHGLDGHGGDKGPNIAGSARVRHLPDTQVSNIISNGIPGTGMPAFHNLSTRQIGSLVA